VQPPASPERKTNLLKTFAEKKAALPFHKKTKAERYRIVLEEQNGKCLHCDTTEIWNGKLLRLQLDHISGNRQDNRRENLRALCPNCHYQTPTWGFKKRHV